MLQESLGAKHKKVKSDIFTCEDLFRILGPYYACIAMKCWDTSGQNSGVNDNNTLYTSVHAEEFNTKGISIYTLGNLTAHGSWCTKQK